MNAAFRSIGFISVFSLLLSGCSKEAPQSTDKPIRFAATMIVGTLDQKQYNFYSGEIHARHETVLAFRVGGKIVERLVDAGAAVKAGQLLARIDAADTGLQKSSAAAQLQLVEDDLKRNRELLDKGFISQAVLDAKVASYKVAKAQDDLAQNQNAYTNLISDHAGVVVATLADVGQVVNAGQAVMQLAQEGEREVLVAIPESRFSALKIGMPAEIELSVEGIEPHKKYSGRLRELSPAADAASRTYAARVTVTNDDSEIVLGMTARVKFGVSSKLGGQLVPLSAIFQQGDKPALWIVSQDGSVSLRTVTVVSYQDEGAMISSGLNSGERIVSAGVHKLTSGEKIKFADNGILK
jgi:RND family efflux transporter MFP subunit